MANRCATGSWLMALTVLFARLGMLGGMRCRARRGLLRSERRCGLPRWLHLLRCPALLDRRRTLLNRRTLLKRLTLLIRLRLLISGRLSLRLRGCRTLLALLRLRRSRTALGLRLTRFRVGMNHAHGASRFASIGAVHRATPHGLYHAGSGECGGT